MIRRKMELKDEKKERRKIRAVKAAEYQHDLEL